jgi:hypothetical protein
LLEARERQLAVIRRAEAIKREAEAAIREKLGQADEAIVEGWTLELKRVNRREFVQPAVSYTRIVARRLEPIGEELAGEERHSGGAGQESSPAPPAAGLRSGQAARSDTPAVTADR